MDSEGGALLASQTRLLHVLQDKEIERLGGEGRRMRIDVRVIAATNPQEVLGVFRKHAWPGNVRQLENLVQRAVAMGETEQVLLQDIPK